MTRFYLNKEECALLFDKLTKMRDDLKNRGKRKYSYYRKFIIISIVELESTVGEYKQKIVRTETINTEHQIFYLTVYEDSNGGTLFISRHLYEQQGQRPLIKSIGVPLTGLEMFYKALSNILERIGQTTTIKGDSQFSPKSLGFYRKSNTKN
jgi:hypothetical protein